MLPVFMLISQLLLQLFFKHIQWKWRIKNWAIGILVMIITISPWTIHNLFVHEEFVPIHTASGYMMLICNGKLNHPDIQKGLFYYKDEQYKTTLNDNLTEIENPYDNNFTRNDLVMALVYIPILMFFILSLFKGNFENYWPVLVIILYVFITILPFWGSPRFRFPIDSLIIMMASFGFVSITSTVKNKFPLLMKINTKITG